MRISILEYIHNKACRKWIKTGLNETIKRMLKRLYFKYANYSCDYSLGFWLKRLTTRNLLKTTNVAYTNCKLT
jgi:hypothetical protein